MITCQECEAEFEIIHDSIGEPEFCPFCSAKLVYDDEGLEEEDNSDWYPDP
jgi:uncharacterized paraquat-inducible protein A